jgi:K+-transporting ATPase ATPase B chain
MDAISYQGEAARTLRSATLLDRSLLPRALRDAVLKLNPASLIRNPVIFVTEIVSILVTLLTGLAAWRGEAWGFQVAIAAWLWATVLFANFAEAVAEGRGRARAESLRRARSSTRAKLLVRPDDRTLWQPRDAADLREDDVVLVEAGDLVPADGEVIAGIASVNEAAVTGESAPVIRESGGDRSAVTGGTLVVSDWLVVRWWKVRRGRRRRTRSPSTSCSRASPSSSCWRSRRWWGLRASTVRRPPYPCWPRCWSR